MVLEALRRQGYEPGAPAKPISELRCDLPVEALHRALTQLSHPMASCNPLVECQNTRARLSHLGHALFAPDGSWQTLPFSLLLVRGVDGVPPHNLTEVLQLARSALIALRAGMEPAPHGCGPDFPWGGVLHHLSRDVLAEAGSGTITVGSRVDCQLSRQSLRARVVMRELPPQLDIEEVAGRIRQLEAPGVDSVESRAGCIEVELTHPVHALWLQWLIHRNAIGEASWPVNLPAPVRWLLTRPIERCVKAVLAAPGSPLEALELAASRLEGMLVFLELGERVLDVLRDAEDEYEMKFALTHLATEDLRSLPSFARHVPLSPAELRAAAERVLIALNDTQPFEPQRVRADYSRGLIESQAHAIANTKRLKSLSKPGLLRELRDVVDELARKRAQHAERERAFEIVDASLSDWMKRFAPSRRTLSYRYQW